MTGDLHCRGSRKAIALSESQRSSYSVLWTLMVLLVSTSFWAAGETTGEEGTVEVTVTENEREVTVEGGEKRTIEVTVVESEGGSGVVKTEIVERDQQESGPKKRSADDNESSDPSIRVDFGQSPTKAFIARIREAYATLSKYTKASGHDLRFELSGFETLMADRFDEICYADTSTLPGDMMLTIKRGTHTDYVDGVVTVEYNPEWEFIKTDWSAFQEGRRMLGMTLQEVLHEVGTSEPTWLRPRAVTRFDVAASFENKVRTYRAAFFWIPGKSEGEWRARALDHITQGINLVLKETIPPGGIAIPHGSSRITCEAEDGNISPATNPKIFTDVDFPIKLSCDNLCTSACDWTITNLCSETANGTRQCF